jgi:hypothetical protein
MKKKVWGLCLASSLLTAENNEELLKRVDALSAEVEAMKARQQEQSDSFVEEIGNLRDALFAPAETYESFSSMGEAASKVYHSKSAVSIGGYGEYKYKKYIDFKNYDDDAANETRRKSEFNIVRFVPYIGFRFNDWIVMNTEIEFEDGGARSDNTKNYKYAIVEFSYLDFLFDEAYALRVGHVLVPFGLVNLNHEPVAYLTSERPTVETLIIPSTWHTNGVLLHGKTGAFEYYAGVVTSPDAGSFVEGRYIQQGRLGARQFTDDLSFVARAAYDLGGGLNLGASLFYGGSSVLEENKPGDSTGHTGDAEVTMTMAEIHATYQNHGFDIQTLAVYGGLDGDVDALPGNTGDERISGRVNGQYLTVGYDLLNTFSTSQQLFAVADVERLDLDADGKTLYPDNHRFMEYSGGVAYFPDPKVTVKADYWVRDYGSDAMLADESAFTATIGFIF